MTWKWTAVAVGLLVFACSVAPEQPDLVITTHGTVRGQIREDVAIFLGIPFAAPPVGELRWRAPQPPSSWEGIREVREYAPDCAQGIYQGSGDDRSLSEDCLYLNVWAPVDRGDQALPVLFWIHDGGYVNGSAADPISDGTVFAHNRVILVSANYRLGWFGTFAHPALTAENADDDLLASYNILDQIAALHWVRENIAGFGGDPDRVTIFGISAGAASVRALMVSPLARNLFAGAIAQSVDRLDGLPQLRPAGDVPSGEKIGLEFAARHGIVGDGAEALADLRALPTEEVVEGLHLGTISSRGFPFLIIGGKVIPEPMEGVFRKGEQAEVPFIVGANDADGFYPWFGGTREQVFNRFGELREEAEALYDPDSHGDLRTYATWALADLDFLESARHYARLHTAQGHPTWVYRFSYVRESLREERVGAWHASDKPYLFNTLGEEPTQNDLQAGDQLRAYWIAFSRHGTPSPEGLPEWPRFDPNEDVLMNFLPEGPIAQPDPARDRLDLAERVADRRR